MSSEKPKTYSEEVKIAFRETGLSKAAAVQRLQAEGVTHGRSSIEKWLDGKKPARSAVAALSKILSMPYESDTYVEAVYSGTKWGNESKVTKTSKMQTTRDDPAIPNCLHHVSLPVRNLNDSVLFYQSLLGKAPSDQRPGPPNGFPFEGAWFILPNDQHLHLVNEPDGTYRREETINPKDCHFALRVMDFTKAKMRLNEMGIKFIPDPYSLGYLQLYFLDPDWHVIEINALYQPEDGQRQQKPGSQLPPS